MTDERHVTYRAAAELQRHPSAAVVPWMSDHEWASFISDVRERGILEPLQVARDGRTVLDGRHRLQAAHDLRIESVPTIPAPLGGLSEEDFMLRAALIRRNLSEDQRAILADRLREIWSERYKHHRATQAATARYDRDLEAERLAAEAEKLRAEGIDPAAYLGAVGESLSHTSFDKQQEPGARDLETFTHEWVDLEADGQPRCRGSEVSIDPVTGARRDARAEAAVAMRVPLRKLQRVRKVKRLAPDLVPAVESGLLSLRDAERQATARVWSPPPPWQAMVWLRRAAADMYWLKEKIVGALNGLPSETFAHQETKEVMTALFTLRRALRVVCTNLAVEVVKADAEARQHVGPYPDERDAQKTWLHEFNQRRFEAFERRVHEAGPGAWARLANDPASDDEPILDLALEKQLRELLGDDEGETEPS